MAHDIHPLGEAISLSRKRLGLSQTKLADRAGVSLDVINNLEKGRQANTSSEKAAGIARALAMSVDELNALARSIEAERHASPRPDPPLFSGSREVPAAVLRQLVARAAEDVLVYVREEKLPDDPAEIAKEIASVFAQLEENERANARPIVAQFGGKIIELRQSARRG